MVVPNTGGNPLAAGSLTTFMACSLPKDASKPLKTSYDAIALACHAGMIAVGFRLIGLGEDDRIESTADAQDPQPLPSQWNATSTHSFRYSHPQSSMQFLLKVNSLGPKAIVFALAIGDDKTTQFELTVDDYVSKHNVSSNALEAALASNSTEDQRKALQDIFINEGRLSDLGSLLKLKVIQKLAPSISKEGYEESSSQRETDDPNARNERQGQGSNNNPRRPPPRDPENPDPARPHPFHDPLANPPRAGNRPLPEPIPGFEDEHEILRGPRGGIGGPARSPFAYGEQDLYPPGLGPHDPIRPHFGGGLPRPGGGGGMHPTFDDPLFGGGAAGDGIGGFDPQAPPGARYDPVGPGGAPRDRGMGGRFPGGGGGLGGRPPNPFSGFGDGDFI